MNLTATARNNFVAELIAFQKAANEIRNRFYDFLVAHNPVEYADYQILPFANSTEPLAVGYFELVPYLGDISVDELAAEPSNVLSFKGPLSKFEIKCDREAEDLFRGLYEDDNMPFIRTTQDEWNDKELYINVPDAYLDDPDGWESTVIAAIASDRQAAEEAMNTPEG